MSIFHIIKQSRKYEGSGYCGAASNHNLLEFDSLDDAINMIDKLQTINKVGWLIFNAITKEQVYPVGNV
jgi:hypothetical protein